MSLHKAVTGETCCKEFYPNASQTPSNTSMSAMMTTTKFVGISSRCHPTQLLSPSHQQKGYNPNRWHNAQKQHFRTEDFMAKVTIPDHNFG